MTEVKASCITSSGNPAPSIWWTKDNHKITNGSDYRIVEESQEGDHGGVQTLSTLTFNATRDRKDEYTTLYQCHSRGRDHILTQYIALTLKGTYGNYLSLTKRK